MAEKEIHTVGLGQVRKVAPRNRASKAMKLLKEYVLNHTDAETVSVSNAVNEKLWENGARNPPRSIDIQVLEEDSKAHVELSDLELELEEEPGEEEVDVEYTELTDEDIAEMNVDEVKELVEDGTVDAERALDIEYAGKNRKTLISWLKERVEDAEEEGEGSEEVEEGEEEEVEEEETGEEKDADEETYDLPEDVVETFEEGNISEGKEAARSLGKQEFEKLLNFEEAHQNRKGMKKFLRSNMN